MALEWTCTVFHVEFPHCVWAGKYKGTWVMQGAICEPSARSNQNKEFNLRSTESTYVCHGPEGWVFRKKIMIWVTNRGLSLENDGHVYAFVQCIISCDPWDKKHSLSQEVLRSSDNFLNYLKRTLRLEPRTKTHHKQGAYIKNSDILIRIFCTILAWKLLISCIQTCGCGTA